VLISTVSAIYFTAKQYQTSGILFSLPRQVSDFLTLADCGDKGKNVWPCGRQALAMYNGLGSCPWP